MDINGYYPIDPASAIDQYGFEGLSLELLRKCNSMTFKMIGGYGEGFFLFNDVQAAAITGETATLTITATQDGSTKTVPVYVLNKLKLHHPNQTDAHFVVLHVAEEKYGLSKDTITRNYNLVNRQTITALSPVPFKAPDDETQTSLATILATETGMTIGGSAASVIPYECIIQGLDCLSAIDRLCRCYAMLWTVDNGTLYVYSVTSAGIPDYTRINDIRKTTIATRMNNFTMLFPVVANGDQRNSLLSEEITGSGEGESVTTYNPYFPAVLTKEEVDINSADRATFITSAQPYFEGIMDIQSTYIAFHYYNPYTGAAAPFYFEIIFADFGAGPRTICKADAYPFLDPPDYYKFDATPGTGETSTPEPTYAIFKLTASMAKGAGNTSAGATVLLTNDSTAPSTITVYNTGDFRGYVDAEGLAIKMRIATGPDVFRWIVVHVNQPALRVFAILKQHPIPSPPENNWGAHPQQANAYIDLTGSLPTILTPYPFSFRMPEVDTGASGSIPNPYNLFGEAGDGVILEWDGDSDEYAVAQVIPQQQRMMFASLTAPRDPGLGSVMTAAVDAPLGDGAFPVEPFDVRDRYNVAFNAKTGDRIVVAWDARTLDYVALAAEHTATELRCTVTSTLTGTFATFTGTVVTAYNGASPGGTVTIANRFNWDSVTAGKTLEVKYDPIDDEWYPIQMECP